MTRNCSRRALLAGAAGGAAALAGCGGLIRRQRSGPPPLVADRPDAVYVPSHVEGMELVGTRTAGDLGVALAFTFPHRFWLVTGAETRKVSIRDAAALHLMAVVWDRRTGRPLPGAAPHVELVPEGGGPPAAVKNLWPMLSQPMGVHFGDDVELAGGEYEARVRVGPPTTPRLDGPALPERPRTVTFDLVFDEKRLEQVAVRSLDDRQGERGAVEPMAMGALPDPRAPHADALPGTERGRAAAGDAVFHARALSPSRAGTDAPYLAVSVRTRYNRYPLPELSLSAAPAGGDRRRLVPALDPDLGYHYGAPIPRAGERAHAISVDAPPQAARHEGYETAFLDRPTVRVP